MTLFHVDKHGFWSRVETEGETEKTYHLQSESELKKEEVDNMGGSYFTNEFESCFVAIERLNGTIAKGKDAERHKDFMEKWLDKLAED